MADEFKVVFELDVDRAISSAERLKDTLGKTVASLEELGKTAPLVNEIGSSLQTSSRGADRFASSMSRGARESKRAADEMRKATEIARNFQHLPDQGTDTRRVGSSFGTIEGPEKWANEMRQSSLAMADQSRAAQMLDKNLSHLATTRERYVPSTFGEAFGREDKAIQQSSRSYLNLSTSIDQTIETRQRESQAFSSALRTQMEGQAQLARGLSTTRYALYDMANTLGLVGGAMLGLSAATFGASIAWERDFANVIRTSNLDPLSRQVEGLRQGFQDLASVIPVSSSELAEIGTLAGQLGIAARDMVDFTSVVARMAATTDLSVEQAATAFGRLKALLPDMADGSYSLEQLASSILRVGTNSVATEGEITSIATQLSSMAAYAGLSADEVVGLAGALASVGTQPELARGTVTRLFTQMGKAISEGGERLEAFGRISGVSGREFANAFGTDRFGPILLQFIQGLHKVSAEGGDAIAVLRELGITSVRDVPALTRWAMAANSAGEAGGLFAQTLEDAKKGLKDGTELAEQYGVIAGTVAAKLQLFANNIQNFMVVLGGGGGIFGGLLDILNDVMRTLTSLARNPVFNAIGQGVLVFSALVGVAALLGAGLAVAAAGAIAVTQALHGMSTSGIFANGIMKGLSTQLIATGGAAATAGRAVSALAVAFRALNIAGLAIGSVALASQTLTIIPNLLQGARRGLTGFNTDLDATRKRLEDTGTSAESFGTFMRGATDNPFLGWATDVMRSLADIIPFSIEFINDLKRMDEAMSDLVTAGRFEVVTKELTKWSKSTGISVEDLMGKLHSLRSALESSGIEVVQLANGQVEFRDAATGAAISSDDLTGALTELEKAEIAAEEKALALAMGLGLSEEGFDRWEKAVKKAADGAINLKDAISEATNDGIFSLQKFNEALNAQITALTNWENNLLTLISKGVDSRVITYLNDLGPKEGAQLVQGLVDGMDTKLGQDSIILMQRGIEMQEALADGFTQKALLVMAAAREGDEAAAEIVRAIAEGASEDKIQAIMDKYNIRPPVDVDLDPARRSVQSFDNFLKTPRAMEINAAVKLNLSRIDAQLSRYGIARNAEGGMIRGPGTGTSDSILSRLSNGEYVIRASSVRKYGQGLFDQLNRGVAKFANGGPVGGGSTSSSVVGTGIMELGPKSLGRLGGGGPVINIVLDDVAIARAANRGQKKISFMGEQS